MPETKNFEEDELRQSDLVNAMQPEQKTETSGVYDSIQDMLGNKEQLKRETVLCND